MLAVFSWWLIVEILGLLALPLAWRVLRHLPGRGYAFAKPLGLLLVGYVFWIGGSFGMLSNSRTAILFCMSMLGLVSLWVWLKNQRAIGQFVSDNRRLIVACEVVFALAFAGWSLVRAYNPEIAATEKPMEIAFLNAILRSERFPPHDPWLSGFAISYYYFGYLLMALLTKLSGVAASVAFNLAIALLFGLTALGSFGLVYNLIAVDRGPEGRSQLEPRRAFRGIAHSRAWFPKLLAVAGRQRPDRSAGERTMGADRCMVVVASLARGERSRPAWGAHGGD
jgi:uncharacterized membrane protein